MKFTNKIKLSILLIFLLMAFQTLPSFAADKNFLWELESKSNTVYLLGSIHLLSPKSYPLSEEIEAAFDEAEVVVVETDMDSLTSPDVQQMMLMKAMNAEGKTLKQRLDEATYNQIKTELENMGLSMIQFETFEPWFLAMTVTAFKFQQMGFNPDFGIDKYFFDKAKQNEKVVESLESAEFQINLFDQMSDETQAAFLKQTLEDLEVMEEEIDKIVDAWKTGDTDTLEDLLLESYEKFPEVYEKFVSERNRNWIPQIEGFINQEDDYLIVVGALHLVGDDGVIELLKDKGYSVEQQ